LLTHYVQTDLGGLTRGRAAWNGQSDSLDGSVGWMPVNQIISPLDTIASPNPWGSSGDCRLRPDKDTLVEVKHEDGSRLRAAICDLAKLDGRPHPLCSRDFLRRGAQALADEGLTPPLIISDGEIDQAIDIVNRAIRDAVAGRIEGPAVNQFAGW